MANQISLRNSVQFPPDHHINSNPYTATMDVAWVDETGLTSNGLHQKVLYHNREVISQFLMVDNKKIELDTKTSVEDAITLFQKYINKDLEISK